ncbi:hypothetical protein QJQ45_009853 [Haematococcus lacustris]|nr:hypothetical protein QJQ45_009853 [Haematococcus lacustris]
MVCGLDVSWLLEEGGVVVTAAMQAEVALQRGLLGLEKGELVDEDWVEDPANRGRLLRHAGPAESDAGVANVGTARPAWDFGTAGCADEAAACAVATFVPGPAGSDAAATDTQRHPANSTATASQLRRPYVRTSVYWKRPRNYKAYYRTVRDCLDDRYPEEFHVTREVFYLVLEAISGDRLLQRQCLRRDYLPVEEQLAIALSYFAKGGTFSLIGGRWGCSKTSVSRCVRNVSMVIQSTLAGKMVLPQSDEAWAEYADGFSRFVEYRWGVRVGMPQVVLAMDGTQVRLLRKPPGTGHDYYNYKGFNSMNVHGVCDHRGVFCDVLAGFPGRCHDYYVLQRTGLWEHLLNPASPITQAFERGARRIGGRMVPYMICADSAYPPRRYILPAIRTTEARDQGQRTYNRKHASTRNVIERAFGQVKARFQCLHHGLRTEVDTAPYVIMACFLLHNICVMRGVQPMNPDDLLRRDEVLGEAVADFNRRLHEAQRQFPHPAHRGQVPAAALQEGRDIRDAVVLFAAMG